jgi:hypothetical protein
MSNISRLYALLAIVCCCSALGCRDSERTLLERALVGRGHIALVGDGDWAGLHASGATLTPVSASPAVAASLDAGDPAALVAAMVQAGVHGLLVETLPPGASGHPLRGRLARFARLPGLQGVFFAESAALYALDPVRDWSPVLRDGLAELTRRLLGGAEPPRTSSFPEPVRRLDPVEVMVLLRSGSQPRLWRSARGSSFARALLTAADVARQRWIERSQALGGPIQQMLPRLTVEVALLQDDGEIGVRNASFVDRVVKPLHGIGYERKGSWHYLLPEAAHSGGRRASAAFQQLFRDDGLSEDSLDNRDLRPYRLAVQSIGVSEPPPRPDDGLSDVRSPAEVLDRK